MTGFKPGDRVFHRGLLRNGTVTTIAGPLTIVAWDDGSQTTAVSTDYLEPLGEPMSKTFPSAESSSDSTLVIDSSGDCGILKIMRGDYYIGGINLDPVNAPTLALAILEAAGVQLCRDPKAMAPTLSSIACDLEELVVQLEMDAKEAADRESLEGEAWDFANAHGGGAAGFKAFGHLAPRTQERWLSVARRARELRGVTA